MTALSPLPGSAEAAPLARQLLRDALDGVTREVVDDAETVVTELVTNAVLHGTPPLALRVVRLPGAVRLEVHDAGRGLPMRMRPGTDSLTGRGLALVAALSRGWGVERAGDGKAVWAELLEQPGPEGDTGGDVDVDALLSAWAEADDEPLVDVELGDVPTALLIAAKSHVDNLVREWTLRTEPEDPDATSHLAALVRTVEHDFAAARDQIKIQAVQAAERGETTTRLRLSLPVSAADAADRYLSALDEADRYARDARLLTLETPAAQRVFRRWYVDALALQLRAAARGAPAPRIPTLLERLVDEVTELADSREAASRLELVQRVTAALAGAATVEDVVDAVVVNATRTLDAHAARIYLRRGDLLRSVATSGGEQSIAQRFEEVPVGADLPGGVALRERRNIVARNRAQLARQFAALRDVYPDERTLLVAPLLVGDAAIGVLSLSFLGESSVDDRTQDAFLGALATVTSQALGRVGERGEQAG